MFELKFVYEFWVVTGYENPRVLKVPLNKKKALKWGYKTTYTPGSSNVAVPAKWGPRIEDVFPIKNGIFHCYVSYTRGYLTSALIPKVSANIAQW